VFDFSFETLFVLGLLAFILFGPQKLPEYAAKLGRLTAKLRQATSEMTQQVNNPFQYPQEPGQPGQMDQTSQPAFPNLSAVFTCPYCRHTAGPGFIFCSQCGRRISEEQLELPFSADTSASRP
jgi:Sec-independent protein translocase protein TatA